MHQDENPTCKLSAIDNAQSEIGVDRQWVSGKTASLLLVASAYGLGGGGMAAWLFFVFWGPWTWLSFNMGVAGSLFIDALLCLLFFIQHSIMVRRGFRLWLTRIVRAEFHGTLYASAAGACLLAVVLFWQPAGPPFWRPPFWFHWMMAVIFLIAAGCAWWGSRSLGEFDALGIRPALDVFGHKQSDTAAVLTVRGPYRWVRHPLYFLSLVIIWAGPVFTLDRLLHNVLWSIWIVVGARYEERDLEACFGEAYRAYKKSVPMLLPRSFGPRVPASDQAQQRPQES